MAIDVNMRGIFEDKLKYGKGAKGRSALKKILAGLEVSPRQIIEAQCYVCMGGYEGGKVDCKGRECCLAYPYMSYKNVVEGDQ